MSNAGVVKKFAGMDVKCAVAMRPKPLTRTPAGVFRVVKSLLTGMKVTIKYLVNPKTVVTQQYPENRETLKMFDRYRARLTMPVDDKGRNTCTACRICETACPNGSIIIDAVTKGPITKKAETQTFTWRLDTCTFCSLCVFSCPHGSIEWTGEWETAVYDRRLLIYNLNTYAGPPARQIDKIEGEDPELGKQLQEQIKPVDRYTTGTPLCGTSLPGAPAQKDIVPVPQSQGARN